MNKRPVQICTGLFYAALATSVWASPRRSGPRRHRPRRSPCPAPAGCTALSGHPRAVCGDRPRRRGQSARPWPSRPARHRRAPRSCRWTHSGPVASPTRRAHRWRFRLPVRTRRPRRQWRPVPAIDRCPVPATGRTLTVHFGCNGKPHPLWLAKHMPEGMAA